MIWEKLVVGAGKVRASAKNSFFVQTGIGKPRPVGEASALRLALHRAVRKHTETAYLTALFSRLLQVLLSAALHCYGAFFLSFGGIAFFAALLFGKTADFDFLSFGILLSGIPLCFSHERLADALEKSDLARLFLVRYCGFAVVFPSGQAANRIWQFSFAGAVAGAFGVLFGVRLILLLLIVSILLPILFSVPEAVLPPIFLLFPFLSLTGHASFVLGVFAALALVFRLPKLLSGHRQDPFEKTDLLVLVAGFLLIFDGVISASGFDGTGVLLCGYLFSAWFALRPALRMPKWRNRIFFCFLLSGSVCSAAGILQYFSGKAAKKWLEIGKFDLLGGRVTATFSNPNFLAVYLLVVFGVSLGWLSKAGKGRFFGWIPLLLSSGCLIVTWTRGAWLGVLAAVCFYLALNSASTLAAFFVLPLSLPGIVSFLPEGIRARFGSIGNLAETSSRYRIETWKGVLRLIADHPFGIGSGEETFHFVYPPYAVSGTESVMHAHNVYLQIAVEHGFVGVILFLLSLLLLFRGFFAAWIGGNPLGDRGFFLGLAAALVGLLTMGLFDHLWYQPSLFYLFAMLAAGLSAFAWIEREEVYET